MPYSRDLLASIVERSSTLAERFSDQFEPTGDGEADADSLIAKWRETISPASSEGFERRLRWDGLSIGGARARLGGIRLRDGIAAPAWTTVLNEIVHAAGVVSDELASLELATDRLPDRALTAGDVLPFEDILLPIVRVARTRLLARLLSHSPNAASLATESALADLERALLGELGRVFGETLSIELSVRRSATPPALTAMPTAKSVYATLRDAMLRDGMSSFFARYPVLARLAATRVLYWVEATEELFARLHADAEIIERELFDGMPLAPLAHVSGGVGDSHRGGRAVRVLTFADDRRVVYKPRPVVTDAVLAQLVAEINPSLSIPLRTPRCVARSGHGWVEFMAGDPCADADGLARYHRRIGMLVALAYALGASDLHHENIIASGEHPILIDLEVLPASPPTLDPRHTPNAARFTTAMWESVLRTALIPVRDRRRRMTDFGGMVRPNGERARRYAWSSINTDWMARHEEEVVPDEGAPNLPRLDGTSIAPDGFTPEILAGFRELYDTLVDRRESLRAPDGPLVALRAARSRVVLRDTSLYGSLMRCAAHPLLLESGAARSIALDVVFRTGIGREERPTVWATYHSEAEALFHLDVPYFSALAGDTVLSDDAGRPIADYTDQSAFDRMMARLAALSVKDREQQAAIVEVALRGYGYRRARRETGIAVFQAPASSDGPLSPETLLEEARRLADELRVAALDGNEGCWWTGVTHDVVSKNTWVGDTGASLGHGAGGIGLFFAALHRVGGDEDDARAARRALRRLVVRAQRRDAADDRDGVGMAMGTGGMIYALSTVGRWLHDPAFLQAAQDLAAAIGPRTIAADTTLDVYGGSAGLALALLSLDSAVPTPRAISQAKECGRHLLESRVRDKRTGRLVWQTIDDEPTTGFAHGSSGIAYALLRLHARTREPAFLDGALEALAYEDQLFLSDRGNWLETSTLLDAGSDEARLWCTWCHGAPGIGLARLGALQWTTAESAPALAPRLTADLETAMATTLRTDLATPDHLCCGNFGRIAMLADAARLTGSADALASAHELARRAVVRAREVGSYGTSMDMAFNPGLLAGVSGIGFELLRLAEPHRLAPVLLFS